MGKPSFRPFSPDPVERYWPNCNYGNARMLKTYAHYPASESIWAVIPHGVFYEDDYVYIGEANAKVPAVLQWPEHRDACWGEHKVVVPCAAPFLYALEMVPHAKERRGTIVMPQHSTTLYDMEFDWWAFSDLLRDVPKPITVLLYYVDIQRGVDRYFPGLKIRCCGHVNDPRFLANLVSYLTSAECVVSNEVGSYTYYSVAAGTPFSILGEPPRFVLNQEGIDKGFAGVFHNSEDRHPEEKRRVAEVTELFQGWQETITPEQAACADYYLRRSAFKTPDALRADLEYCKTLHEEKVAARAPQVALAPA